MTDLVPWNQFNIAAVASGRLSGMWNWCTSQVAEKNNKADMIWVLYRHTYTCLTYSFKPYPLDYWRQLLISALPLGTRLPNPPSSRTLPSAFFAFLACFALSIIFLVFFSAVFVSPPFPRNIAASSFCAQLRLFWEYESSNEKSFLFFMAPLDCRHFSYFCVCVFY